jgi:sarcosine oxidase subunit alpha
MPRLSDPRFAPDCAILVDGRVVRARAGESVAVALLAAGRPLVSRSVKYHRPRGPFCLTGSCGTCLARVEGMPSQRLCRTPCREGLAVETQHAFPDAAHDLLGLVDWMSPRGIDHHHLLTRPRLANRLLVQVSRRLSGLGRLPDAAPAVSVPRAEEPFDAAVVGAGPAGLGAAEVLAAAGRRVLLAEQEPALGGRLRAHLGLPGDPSLGWARSVGEAVGRSGGEVALGFAALGIWRDGGAPLLVLLSERPAACLRLVRAPQILLCPGGTARLPLFARNDLPGIFWGRGLGAAIAEAGVVPGRRALVLGTGPEAEALAARLAEARMAARAVAGPVVRARGRARIAGLDMADGAHLHCDTLAVAAPPAPACDLAREAGAAVVLDVRLGAHAVRAGPDGATGVAGLRVAGEVAGACTARQAADAGRRAGEAARA